MRVCCNVGAGAVASGLRSRSRPNPGGASADALMAVTRGQPLRGPAVCMGSDGKGLLQRQVAYNDLSLRTTCLKDAASATSSVCLSVLMTRTGEGVDTARLNRPAPSISLIPVACLSSTPASHFYISLRFGELLSRGCQRRLCLTGLVRQGMAVFVTSAALRLNRSDDPAKPSVHWQVVPLKLSRRVGSRCLLDHPTALFSTLDSLPDFRLSTRSLPTHLAGSGARPSSSFLVGLWLVLLRELRLENEKLNLELRQRPSASFPRLILPLSGLASSQSSKSRFRLIFLSRLRAFSTPNLLFRALLLRASTPAAGSPSIIMLRLPLSLASLVLSTLLPSATSALNWTSTRDRPAFSDPAGDKIRGVNLGGWVRSSSAARLSWHGSLGASGRLTSKLCLCHVHCFSSRPAFSLCLKTGCKVPCLPSRRSTARRSPTSGHTAPHLARLSAPSGSRSTLRRTSPRPTSEKLHSEVSIRVSLLTLFPYRRVRN